MITVPDDTARKRETNLENTVTLERKFKGSGAKTFLTYKIMCSKIHKYSIANMIYICDGL